MTCANILLTLFAALAVLLTYTAEPWTSLIPAVIIIVIAWTMVDCKPCKVHKKK